MTILLSDPRVTAVPLEDCGEPLAPLPPRVRGPRTVRVRAGLAARLGAAQSALPRGLRLLVVEGYRSPRDQQDIIDRYSADLRAIHPEADEDELARLTSRFVSPLAVAPHVAGAAVDVTLADEAGDELDMGTPIDATPEQSDGRCFFGSPDVLGHARTHRTILASALTSAGLVNYPTEWWHWSYGDRYWALTTGAPRAVYGPCRRTDARAA